MIASPDRARPWVVTGAAGFIGHRVVELARAQGRPVISVDRLRSGGNPFLERPEHGNVPFGETLDRVQLLERLEVDPAPSLPEVVIHLGACTDTQEEDEAYLEDLNGRYCRQLWSVCSRRGVRLIYASSAATYGDGANGYGEDEALLPALRPLNPYGWSKHRFDLWAIAQAGRGLAPPSWAGLKLFNVYGFGERHKGPMASMVLQGFDQIRSQGRLRLFRSHRPGLADGEQSRDFVFIDDVVRLLLTLGERSGLRGLYNVGTGKARTFLELARAVFASLEAPGRIDFADMPVSLRARYQNHTQASVVNLQRDGLPAPRTSLEEGVELTVRRLLQHEREGAAPGGERR